MSVNRIVEVSNPAYLKTANKQLVIEKDHEVVGSIPFEDLHAVILTNPQITVSIGVLQRCVSFNVPVIVCNEKHLPTGYLFSPFANSLHSKLVRCQAKAKTPLKKNIWKEIVISKIRHQGLLLDSFGLRGTHLLSLTGKVRSGDPDNVEAQAASYYWKELFGPIFRRDPELDGINTLLNYGYSIIRASCARALAGSGLNPTFGVFHRNQYNPFCLADDLMETFRPLVDQEVYSMSKSEPPKISPTVKSKLLQVVNSEVIFDNQRYYFTNAIQRCSKSLAEAFLHNDPLAFNTLKLDFE